MDAAEGLWGCQARGLALGVGLKGEEVKSGVKFFSSL